MNIQQIEKIIIIVASFGTIVSAVIACQQALGPPEPVGAIIQPCVQSR